MAPARPPPAVRVRDGRRPAVGRARGPSDIYAIARNPEGEARAFQRYVPYRGGLSLDAMRRLDDDPNGISDALVAATLVHARELGLDEVSLNFAGFGHLMAADELERRSHRARPLGAAPPARPLPARAPRSLREEVRAAVAPALPRLHRAHAPAARSPARHAGRGVHPGARHPAASGRVASGAAPHPGREHSAERHQRCRDPGGRTR